MSTPLEFEPAIVRGPQRPDLLHDEILADLLEATARRVPDKVALIAGCRQMTYAELDAAADRVAHHLISRGVRPGQMVALWLPRGLALMIAQAGIAKTGAAWLPLDEDTPKDRILVCMEDANAVGLLTQAESLAALHDLPVAVWAIEDLDVPVSGALQRRQGARPEHPAYVIYTSGSTGKPKGIAINQGSICHFLRAENDVLGIRSDDLVYQGFSVSFDMSFEEIWIAYLVGATLWLAPKALTSDPEALPARLREAGVTVLHAVPTLLALFAEEVPGLRIINLGGEMCPDTVVERWASPQRQVFNTYGPTEATVSASLAVLRRGKPVTIGKPLPNYGLLVLNEQLQLVPVGEVGELCIFGPGVALGYLGRPDLTAEKFIDNPYAESVQEQRMYRTGDLARIEADGTIHCLGRADDQIKIRGFRVELGEIEAVLCEQDGVGTAAVVVRQDAGMDQLIAFYAAELGSQPDSAVLRQGLKQRLPAYMVPARFVQIEHVPRLTSGKIDRKALRAMALPAAEDNGESDVPQNATEEALFAVLGQLFPGVPLRLADDFFDDLGGHSLLAARLVSRLRQQPGFAHVAVADIYRLRRIGALAGAWHPREAGPAVATATRYTAPLQRALCGVMQALVLPPVLVFQIGSWLLPFFTYHYFTGEPGDSRWVAIAWALLAYVGCLLLSFAVSIVGRRLLFAGLQPGRYPLWGASYFRWWLADRLGDVAPAYLLANSPLSNWYWRCQGVKVGADVSLGAFTVRVPTLLQVGDGVSIGTAVNLENARVERGELVLGRITLADEAYVGAYSVLQGNTALAQGSRLESLSTLCDGERVPEAQSWQGSPASLVGPVTSTMPPRPALHPVRVWQEGVAYLLGSILVAVLFFLPILPSLVLVDWLDDFVPVSAADTLLASGLRYFLLGMPASALLILVTIVLAVAIRWLVLPRIQPGLYPVHSWAYYRKWLVSQILDASLHVLHGVYATVYAPWWYRLLGAKVGKHAEISSAMGVVPDLLTLGDESFVADAVILGDEEVSGGWMSVRPTVVGNRSFIGNGACVSEGTLIPDNVLIGVQSMPPDNARMQAGQTWMGSPAMHLPAREAVAGFPAELTFRPTLGRKLTRALFEGLRIILPMSFTIAAGYVVVLDVIEVSSLEGYLAGLDELLLAAVCFSVASYALICLLKWLAMGRYRPGAHGMWTLFVWKSEAVTSLYESVAVPNFLNYLRGTPLLPWALRSFGVNVGRNAYLDSTDFTEFDCVTLGDDVELNAWSGPQTHLFEDRVMKVGRVIMQDRVTLHARSTVLYDAVVSHDVEVGPLALVMKGETLPPASRWTGSPVKPW